MHVRGTLNKDSTLFHLNEEFERIERRDKKASLSEQCKEIEGNNRMRTIRDLIKKIRDTKGTFLSKIGTIKDRKGKDLTEAEEIKKSWQEYTKELYKKGLIDQITIMVWSLTWSQTSWSMKSSGT